MTDITERINKFLGHKGTHLIYKNGIQIEWMLSQKQVETFFELNLMTEKCEEIYYNDPKSWIRL